jgi:hypothetical protein
VILSISNKAEVARHIKRNRRVFWVGVVALIAAMITLLITAWLPTLSGLVFLLGYPFLILGLVMSKRGSFHNRRHGMGAIKIQSEADLLADVLEGVPPRYHLYSWLKLGDLPVDHLLVTPMGLLIIMAKSQIGDYRVSHDRYKRKSGLGIWFATVGEPGVGMASQEMAQQVKKLRTWFEQKGYELPVDGVVVFTNPRTKILDAEDMSFPVCHLNDLKAAVRGWETELNMSSVEQQEIEDLIMETLPSEQVAEVRALAQLPSYKRNALLRAQQEAEKEKDSKKKEKEAALAKEKAKAEAAVKPKLTPEEREKLRLERIRANQEKGRQPVNPMTGMMQEPGKRVGIDGKVREDRPTVVEKKPPKRRVEPLRKPTPGAFGDLPATENKKK